MPRLGAVTKRVSSGRRAQGRGEITSQIKIAQVFQVHKANLSVLTRPETWKLHLASGDKITYIRDITTPLIEDYDGNKDKIEKESS